MSPVANHSLSPITLSPVTLAVVVLFTMEKVTAIAISRRKEVVGRNWVQAGEQWGESVRAFDNTLLVLA